MSEYDGDLSCCDIVKNTAAGCAIFPAMGVFAGFFVNAISNSDAALTDMAIGGGIGVSVCMLYIVGGLAYKGYRARNNTADIENPQENTPLSLAQDDEREPETFFRQVGRCGAGLFENCLKPKIESANDLGSSAHPAHQV